MNAYSRSIALIIGLIVLTAMATIVMLFDAQSLIPNSSPSTSSGS